MSIEPSETDSKDGQVTGTFHVRVASPRRI
jgi:hypothetical protein